MKAEHLIDDVERQLVNPLTKNLLWDRPTLLSYMNAEISALAELGGAPALVKQPDPMLQTKVGVKVYPLPDDFPDNFVVGSSDEVDEDYAVVLRTDTDAESNLEYQDPAKFLSEHAADEADSKPEFYTIVVEQAGRKDLWLAPKPDANTYTIVGVYKPTFWDLQDRDDIPPISPTLIKYAILRRMVPDNPFYNNEYTRHYNTYIVNAAPRTRVSLDSDRRVEIY